MTTQQSQVRKKYLKINNIGLRTIRRSYFKNRNNK